MNRLLSLLLVLLAACSFPTSANDTLISVSTRANSVTISNHLAEPVSYFVAAPAYYDPLYDFPPCGIPKGCNTSVPAHSAVTIPYQQILSYRPGDRTAFVEHWRGLAPALNDSVHRLKIELQ